MQRAHASHLCGLGGSVKEQARRLTCLGGRHVQQLRLQHHTLLEQLGVGLDGVSINRLVQATQDSTDPRSRRQLQATSTGGGNAAPQDTSQQAPPRVLYASMHGGPGLGQGCVVCMFGYSPTAVLLAAAAAAAAEPAGQPTIGDLGCFLLV